LSKDVRQEIFAAVNCGHGLSDHNLLWSGTRQPGEMQESRTSAEGILASRFPARRLAAQLVPLSPEIDLLADVFPSKPVLAAQPDGAYVVAWDESGACRIASRFN
jgi:hypothetical protein